MNRNTLAALSLTASLSLTLAACGSGGGIAQSPAPTTSTPPAASGAPSGGVESGVLTAGMECAYAPYNWTQMDSSNGAVPVSNVPGAYANGYGVMIAQRICDANSQELEVASTAWGSLISTFQSGTISMAIVDQSITADRMARVDMASPYYYAGIVCLTTTDNAHVAARDVTDLVGGHYTAQSGTIQCDTCLPQIPDAQIQTATETAPAMVMRFQTGAVDFVYTDLSTATATAANDSDLIVLNLAGTDSDFQFASEEERAENTNIDMSVTKGSTELLDAMNAVLDGMAADSFNTLMDQAITVQPEMQAMERVLALGQDMALLWIRYAPLYLSGMVNTLLLAVTATVLGCLIDLACGLLDIIPIHPQDRLSRQVLLRLLRAVIRIYVEIFRGTPMVLQAVFLYYNLPYFTNNTMRFDNVQAAALLVVSVNTGVYMAKSVRGGILSVDPGRAEGAKTIGMSHVQTMVNVTPPQALHNIIPQIGNNFIINVKDTSVMFIIGLTKFFAAHRYITGVSPVYFPSAAIEVPDYFCMMLAASALLRLMERRMDEESSYELVQADALTMTAGTYRRRPCPQDGGGALA